MSAKVAAIYERQGSVFVSAAHQTTAGFWIDDDHVITISHPTAERLNKAIGEALARSQAGVATPSPSDRMERPVVRAAEVSSWKAFAHSAKHVRVRQTGQELKVTPYRNLGSKEGFEPMTDKVMTLAFGSDQIGHTVMDLLRNH